MFKIHIKLLKNDEEMLKQLNKIALCDLKSF